MSLLLTQRPLGCEKTQLAVTAAAVIKAGAGRVGAILVVAPGTTSGSLTINDAASVGGAAANNVIFTIAFGSMSAGQIINLNGAQFANGLVVSAVPTAGSPQYTILYT